MADVLIIDDDAAMRELLIDMVDSIGHSARSASSVRTGMDMAYSSAYDVVILDVRLPDGNGLSILPQLRDTPSSPEVIIITGVGDPDGAELAVKNGAWDYLQKPLSPRNVLLPLRRVLQYRDGMKGVKKPAVSLNLDGIIGSSPQIKACFDAVAHAADTDANVLITGETGTGKELFAKAVHSNSGRSAQSLVVVDCAALPGSLVESSLFGHVKGAFTGAERPKDGMVKFADRGTLFLDEVGELEPGLQKRFLRVLQERRFRPIGSNHEVDSDFRLVAATNRNLEQMVDRREFRRDLYHRLRSVLIELPPLRHRPDDIRSLVFHYLARICKNYGTESKGVSPELLDALGSYLWPGNVRELIHVLEGAVNNSRNEPILYPKHLPHPVRVSLARAAVDRPVKEETATPAATEYTEAAIASPEALPRLKDYREKIIAESEERYLRDLMVITAGGIDDACRISGLGRARLYGLLKKHGVPRHQ